MNKKYIVLLSSLIACTGWGMNDASKKLIEEWIYKSPEEELEDFHKDNPEWQVVSDDIEDNIKMLRQENNLTADNVCINMRTLFAEKYVSQQAYIRHKYGYIYRNILPIALLGNNMVCARETADGSQIAMLEKEKSQQIAQLSIWKELPAMPTELTQAFLEQIFQLVPPSAKSIEIVGGRPKTWVKAITSMVSMGDTLPDAYIYWVDNDKKVCLLERSDFHGSLDCESGTWNKRVTAEDKKEVETFKEKGRSLPYTNEKVINFCGSEGAIISYKPTDRDIAQYLIKKSQKTQTNDA